MLLQSLGAQESGLRKLQVVLLKDKPKERKSRPEGHSPWERV